MASGTTQAGGIEGQDESTAQVAVGLQLPDSRRHGEWTSKAADPDTEVTVAKWVEEGTPLGINLPIESSGASSRRQTIKDTEQEPMADAALQMAKGNLVNYTSVLENAEDAKAEVERLEGLEFLKRISKRTVAEEFSRDHFPPYLNIQGTPRQVQKEKIIIIDLQRSEGNSKAKLEERLVLPRAIDAVSTMRTLFKPKENVTVAEQRDLWKREMVLIDVSDALPHLAVHHRELERCVTPGLTQDEFFLFRALLFGYKTAPLLWSRVASWPARALQASVPLGGSGAGCRRF